MTINEAILKRGDLSIMQNRWLNLIAGCLIQTILGGVYAWSTFVPYLTSGYQLSSGQLGFIYGASFLSFTTAMIFAGRLLIKKGPRFTTSISAILFLAGYVMAGLSGGSYPLILIGIAGLVGAGIGFGYVSPLSVGMKWFPEKKGFVTGIAVAGFGAGAIMLATVAKLFLTNGVDILSFFLWFGIIAGTILFLSAMILCYPATQLQEKTTTQPKAEINIFNWSFFITVIGIFCGTFVGLVINGNLAPIIQEAGIDVNLTAMAVAIFAIGNAMGRIIWGKLFDNLGFKCIPLSLLSFALIIGTLVLPLPGWAIMVMLCVVAFCFGANFVLYASTISKYFGTEAFPKLYPICFMAYGIAGVIGPGSGGYLADLTGSFDLPLYICIGILVVGGLVTFLKLPAFKENKEALASA